MLKRKSRLLLADGIFVRAGHKRCREKLGKTIRMSNHLSSAISSKAARTAEITKAEKVQSFPLIASSTAAITSFGNRMVLFVVGGIEGILKFDKRSSPRNSIVLLIVCVSLSKISALQKHCRYDILFPTNRKGETMMLDVGGTMITPGNAGQNCKGNGEHQDKNEDVIECCCDECDDYLECFLEANHRR